MNEIRFGPTRRDGLGNRTIAYEDGEQVGEIIGTDNAARREEPYGIDYVIRLGEDLTDGVYPTLNRAKAAFQERIASKQEQLL